jgi:hypothetical protein
MVHPLNLRQEILTVVGIHDPGLNRDPTTYHNPETREFVNLGRIIGEELYRRDTEVFEDEGGNGVVPRVSLVPEEQIGIYRIVPLVLKDVGPQLVGESNTPPLLPHVDDHAQAYLADHLHRAIELFAAIAALRTENVTGKTLTVDPDQYVILTRHVAHHEGKVLFVVNRVGIETQLKLAIPVWHTRT